MSFDPADREVGPGRSDGPTGLRGGLAAAFVANTVDDGPPGLEPTLGALRRALGEIEGALSATGAVRAALTDLAAGSPGDDRVLLSFLRTRLTGPDGRLLEILAGISEEHRALLRAEAEILAIYERPTREPVLALERLAATTAEYRTIPVATYVTPRAKETGRGPLGAIGSLVGGRDAASGGRGARQGGAGRDETKPRRGWLSGLFRSEAAPQPRADATGPAETVATPPSAPEPAQSVEPVAPPAFLESEPAAAAPVPYEVATRGWDHEEATPPPFLDVEPTVAPAPAAGEAPAEDEASRASAIAMPTATTGYGTRSSRPRARASRGESRRDGGSAGRRLVGIALAVVIPAVAAMWVTGLRTADTATAGDESDVAAATSPGSVPAVAASPLTVKDDPAVIPLGDDHGAAGGPIGTAAPAMATTVPVVAEVTTAEGVTVTYRGPTDRKVVALTFDDGYAPPNVRSIFETLVRENVKATFFINGYYLSRDPEIWKEIADAGFPVGNHTYYHVDIRGLDAAAIKQELRMTSSAWKRVTGGRMIPYFRPPYGARTAATDAAVAAAGYKHIVMWDASSADTKAGITDAASLAGALAGGNGSIVLLHAGPDVTPRILKAVIDGYRARGFEFVTIPELLGS